MKKLLFPSKILDEILASFVIFFFFFSFENFEKTHPQWNARQFIRRKFHWYPNYQ